MHSGVTSYWLMHAENAHCSSVSRHTLGIAVITLGYADQLSTLRLQFTVLATNDTLSV